MSDDNPLKKIQISIKISPIVFERMATMCEFNNETRIGVIERAVNTEWIRFLGEMRQMESYAETKARNDLVDALIAKKM